MKKFLFSFVSIAVFLFATVGAAAANGRGRTPVTICHNPGEQQRTIVVDDNAVPAHLAHGDYLGECRPFGDGEADEDEGEDEGGDGEVVNPPQNAAVAAPLPSSGCADPEWRLVGLGYGADGRPLVTAAGNEWHVQVQSWKTAGGVVIGDLGTWDFPLDPDGSFGNGFLPEQNFGHEVALVHVVDGQIVWIVEATMVQVNKETGEVLPYGYQPALIGGYCGDTIVRVDALR